jgi:hypothetical protein
MGMLNQTMLVAMLDLGRRTGLLDALAEGPGTSDDIADRAGLNERYVREWLGALVTGSIAAYDPASATYNLPPAAAACLTGRGPVPAPALTQLSILPADQVPRGSRRCLSPGRRCPLFGLLP